MAIDTSNNVNFSEKKRKTAQIWPEWCVAMRKFRASNDLKATWQIMNTIVPYFCLWYVTVQSIQLDYPSMLIIILIMITAAFLVRMFILFHDCAHNSFFQSKYINRFFGYFFSVFLFISFADWRFTHLRHHGKYANLDSRGYGDVWTMTKKEYEDTTTLQRLRYRLFRNPLVMFGLGVFLLSKRPSYFMVKTRERINIFFTYLLISAMAFAVSRITGWSTYFLIQLPVLWLAGGCGIWLFYIHHQFDGVYWARRGEWNPYLAAMKGSSFYKFPAILNWFSSNIGYHHVHHLDPRIPNYRLRQCYNNISELQDNTPLTIAKSLACFRLKLWDEDLQKMVPFP